MSICDLSIRAYKDKVVPGSRKDALALLLASTEDPESPLTDEELVGAASIFMVAVFVSLISIDLITRAVTPRPFRFAMSHMSWRSIPSYSNHFKKNCISTATSIL